MFCISSVFSWVILKNYWWTIIKKWQGLCSKAEETADNMKMKPKLRLTSSFLFVGSLIGTALPSGTRFTRPIGFLVPRFDLKSTINLWVWGQELTDFRTFPTIESRWNRLKPKLATVPTPSNSWKWQNRNCWSFQKIISLLPYFCKDFLSFHVSFYPISINIHFPLLISRNWWHHVYSR